MVRMVAVIIKRVSRHMTQQSLVFFPICELDDHQEYVRALVYVPVSAFSDSQ